MIGLCVYVVYSGYMRPLLFRVQDHPWDTIGGLTHTFYCRHFGAHMPATMLLVYKLLET